VFGLLRAFTTNLLKMEQTRGNSAGISKVGENKQLLIRCCAMFFIEFLFRQFLPQNDV
jgi:hypothetical protein